MAAVKTYDLGGKRLVKEDIIKLLDDHRVLIKAAFIRGGLRPLTQIAAIALRYSIQPHRSLPDDRIEVVDLNGETLFVVKGFKLDPWKYSWGSDNEAAAQEEKVAEVEQKSWSRKRGQKSEKRLAIEAALQNGVTVKELVAEYGHTSAYFHNIGREIGVKFDGRGKWQRKPPAELTKKPYANRGITTKPSRLLKPHQEEKFSRFDKENSATELRFHPKEGSMVVRPDTTLDQLRAKRLAANAIKPSWRSRVGMFLRTVANRVEGSNA
jgi:hypothetical protein